MYKELQFVALFFGRFCQTVVRYEFCFFFSVFQIVKLGVQVGNIDFVLGAVVDHFRNLFETNLHFSKNSVTTGLVQNFVVRKCCLTISAGIAPEQIDFFRSKYLYMPNFTSSQVVYEINTKNGVHHDLTGHQVFTTV